MLGTASGLSTAIDIACSAFVIASSIFFHTYGQTLWAVDLIWHETLL